MNIKFKIDKNVLIVNGKELSFEYDIRETKLLEDLIIVLLGIPFEKNFLDNLFAINEDGKIAWRVQSLDKVYPKENKLPYEHININESKQITVTDFYGRRFLINPLNGKIIGRDFVK